MSSNFLEPATRGATRAPGGPSSIFAWALLWETGFGATLYGEPTATTSSSSVLLWTGAPLPAAPAAPNAQPVASQIIDQWCKAKTEHPPTFGKRTSRKGKASADTPYKSPATDNSDVASPFQDAEEQQEDI